MSLPIIIHRRPTHPDPQVSLVDRSLRIYMVIVLLLAGVALSVVTVRRYFLHEHYPRNTLLFVPGTRYSDFTGAAVRVEHFGEEDMLSRREFGGPGYEVFPYPIPAVYPHLFYNRVFSHPLEAYLATVVAAVLIAAAFFMIPLAHLALGSKLPYVLVLVTLVTAYPFLYLVDRANLEGLIWILILLGVFCFYRRLYTGAAILLALAASMKLFPALLFLLFIAKQKYRAFAIAVLAAVVLTVLAWAGVGPTIMRAALDSSRSGTMLKEEYVIGLRPLEIGWDHSLLASVKQLAYLFSHLKHGSIGAASARIEVAGVRTVVLVYSVLAPVCWGLLYWFRLRFLPVLNQLVSLLISCILLPFVSNEYTLVHMYSAWGAVILFLFEDVRTGWVRVSPRALVVMLACFAVLFSPQSYWVVGNVDTLGGQVKMAALVVLLWTVIKTPMPSSSLGDLA